MKFTQSAALFGALVVAPISHVTAFAPSTRISISASSASSALRMQQNNHNQKKTFTDSTSFFPFDKPQESEETNTSSSITSSSITSSTALYAKKSKGPNEKASDGSADVRQLLGLKGASESTDIWKIRLQLTKPVTWIPLLWGVMCGAAASGNYHWIWNPLDPTDRNVMLGLEDASKGLVAMILAGPFLTGYTQTINDWYDREIDAINEPYRPIPSGAISEKDVIAQIWVLLLGGLGFRTGWMYGRDMISRWCLRCRWC